MNRVNKVKISSRHLARAFDSDPKTIRRWVKTNQLGRRDGGRLTLSAVGLTALGALAAMRDQFRVRLEEAELAVKQVLKAFAGERKAGSVYLFVAEHAGTAFVMNLPTRPAPPLDRRTEVFDLSGFRDRMAALMQSERFRDGQEEIRAPALSDYQVKAA